MANITVTTLNDELDANPVDSGLSLREAIQIANQSAGADTISFADGLTGTARLTLGELQVTDQLSIDGGGKVTISGDSQGNDLLTDGVTDVSASTDGADLLADNSRLFSVTADAVEFGLSGLTLTGGRTTQNIDSGGALTAADGVTVTISDSQISGNSTTGAGSDGGGLNVEGDLIISGSTISGNSTLGSFSDGGGIFAGSITITGSSVVGNSTDGNYANGGGVASAGAVDATGNFIGLNQTIGFQSRGGGLFSSGVSTLTNNTIYGNLTSGAFSDGAGAFLGGAATLINNTVTGNAALQPGAYGGGVAAASDFSAEGNILIGNAASTGTNVFGSDDPSAVINFSGPNLIGFEPGDTDLSGDPNVSEADPVNVFDQTAEMNGAVAGVAGDNGGPVRTVALHSEVTNPALDAAGTNAPNTDARGLAASVFAGVNTGPGFGPRDLGAFELGGVPLGPDPNPNPEPEEKSLVVTTTEDVVDAFDGVTSLREAVAFANETPGDDKITFAEGGQGLIRLTQGQIVITEGVEIDGDRKVTITGDANDDDITIAGDVTDVDATRAANRFGDNTRIFFTADADGGIYEMLNLTGLTLTGGRSTSANLGGGAVKANGFDVIVENSTLAGNASEGGDDDDFAQGGAIFGRGQVAITNSTISGNRSEGSGGGVVATQKIALTSSTVSGNRATTNNNEVKGGGLYTNDGQIDVVNSIILGNSTASGVGPEIASSRERVEGFLSEESPNSAFNLDFSFSGSNIVGANVDDFGLGASQSVMNASAAEVFAATSDNGGKAAGVLTLDPSGIPIIALNVSIENPALDAAESELATDATGAPRSVDQATVDNGGATDLGAAELRTEVRVLPTPQADELTGTAQAEEISGLRGADTITGLGGADTLNGGGGKDVITGNGGRDVISGGGGKDDLDGNIGRDMVSGNGGRDTVKGGGGKDTLEGGGGKDFLDGGRGRDFLDGSNGNDTLVGGKGNDVLTGGGGSDTFRFMRGDGRDRITDFDQLRDKIEIIDGADSFDDLMITQAGDDVRIKFANVVITVENDQAENFTAADFIF